MTYASDIAQGLVDDVLTTIHKYDESLLLPTVLGCLDIVKAQLLADHTDDGDDERGETK